MTQPRAAGGYALRAAARPSSQGLSVSQVIMGRSGFLAGLSSIETPYRNEPGRDGTALRHNPHERPKPTLLPLLLMLRVSIPKESSAHSITAGAHFKAFWGLPLISGRRGAIVGRSPICTCPDTILSSSPLFRFLGYLHFCLLYWPKCDKLNPHGGGVNRCCQRSPRMEQSTEGVVLGRTPCRLSVSNVGGRNDENEILPLP